MITSLRPRGFTLRTAGAALGCVLVFSSTGLAQTHEALPRPAPIRDALERQLHSGVFDTDDSNLIQSVGELTAHQPLPRRPVVPAVKGARPMPRPPSRRHRSVRTKQVAGAVIGAIGGLVIGGRLGAWLEGDSCRCDDPGFQGFFIGAPIGAGIGAVLGSLVGAK